MRTIAYIDGQNFLYKVAERLIHAGIINDKRELFSVDIPYLLKKLVPDGRMEMRYYGVAKISKNREYGEEMMEKAMRYVDNTRRVRGYLRKVGVRYYGVGNLKVRDQGECRNCGTVEYKYIEKGVDVGLAVDIVRDVLEGRAGRVVLVSSDTDLAPALKVARTRQVGIVYVAFEGQVTESLRRLAGETRILRDEDVIEAYARSLIG